MGHVVGLYSRPGVVAIYNLTITMEASSKLLFQALYQPGTQLAILYIFSN